MNFSEKLPFYKTQNLLSGRFYWVQMKLYSYQINEVESFKKNRILHIAGYLDNYETLHYFHGLNSQFTAHSSLAELANIAGFYDWEFRELDHQFALQMIQEKLKNPDDQLFQKLVVEFLPSLQMASSQEYHLETLLLEYHKAVEYAEL